MLTRKKAKLIHERSKYGSNYLPDDIWDMIFNKIDEKCLFETAYCVCHQWRSVCRLILFWNKRSGVIEFAMLRTNEFDHLVKLLEHTLDQLQQNFPKLHVSTVLFPRNINLSDDQLCYVAKRLPRLKTLNLGGDLNRVTKTGLSRALGYLTEISELGIGPLSRSNYTGFIQETGINYKNLLVLCVSTTDLKSGNTFVLDEHTSIVLANNLPKVKTFLFKRLVIYKSGLNNIMSKCKCLESIIIVWSKQAHTRGSPGFHHTLKGAKSHVIYKDKTENNIIVWVKYIGNVPMNFRSASSMLNRMWLFEADEPDAQLERLPR